MVFIETAGVGAWIWTVTAGTCAAALEILVNQHITGMPVIDHSETVVCTPQPTYFEFDCCRGQVTLVAKWHYFLDLSCMAAP